MATARFWQRGETIDRVNSTNKVIEANTIQAIGKRVGVVAMEAAPGQTYAVNVVGVYQFPKKAADEVTAGAEVYWDDAAGEITVTKGASVILAGYAVADAAASDATVSVKINA